MAEDKLTREVVSSIVETGEALSKRMEVAHVFLETKFCLNF